MRRISIVLCILLFASVITGCIPKTQPVLVTPQQAPAAPVSSEVDTTAKKLLEEYFSALFSINSADEYTENSRTGIIPDSIKKFIAEKTIREGNGNPEIGIHLPRFISINGMTIIDYDLVLLGEEAKPDITLGFVAKNGENLLYFCKIVTKVKVVPNEVFESSYTLQEDNTYRKKKDVSQADVDGMRVEVRYDVELENNNGVMKVLRAIESNIKPGLKNRMFILNNDNINRLPYMDLTLSSDGISYVNPQDGQKYDAERAVIVTFFENLTQLDRERMNLLSHKWKQGLTAVKDYWVSLGITKNKEGSADIITMTEDFGLNYSYEALPLRFNMEEIKGVQNFVITPHPAYSDKIKWYFVDFDASVQRTNGITDENYIYHYDYLVTLSTDKGIIIDKIKLNEYYVVK